eukprot:gnl/Chilomastix_caulleri/1563.p4 GENE.gnl/Chilomastix_caulleri/1563~~gnl/Chilomastix_caulleri/1563.p4  ORF type:complete len:99 (-),score=9.76 gnl/Chilomastix_caulleri/1563:281-577(-)
MPTTKHSATPPPGSIQMATQSAVMYGCGDGGWPVVVGGVGWRVIFVVARPPQQTMRSGCQANQPAMDWLWRLDQNEMSPVRRAVLSRGCWLTWVITAM